MITRLKSIARTVRELSRRAFRIVRYGDAEKVSYFERHTPELVETSWPAIFFSKIRVVMGDVLRTLRRTHFELLSENRALIPDLYPNRTDSGYAKYYVGQVFKNAFSLWTHPRGEAVLPIDGQAEGIYFFIGRHLSETQDGLLEISLQTGRKKKILSKKLSTLEPGWNSYYADLPTSETGSGNLKLGWELKPAGRRAFISGPIIRTAGRGQTALILIADGVRADALEPHPGGSRTPEIDRYFANGVAFENSFSQSNWTLPTFASMATSHYASQHHIVDPDIYSRAMDRRIPTLAELFHKQGFFTYGSVSHRRCNHSIGHHRGFEHFRYAQTVESRHKSPGIRGLNDMNRQLDELIAYLKNLGDVPFFGFAHLFDTHFPFFPDPLALNRNHLLYEESANRSVLKSFRGNLSPEEVQFLHDCFLAKLAELDARLGELFHLLEQRDNVTVILTSDHGYSFANPTGNSLSDEEIRTPFLLSSNQFSFPPGNSPRFVESSVDLLPTLTGLYGIEDSTSRSGLPVLTREGVVPPKDWAISELIYMKDYRLKILGMGDSRILMATGRNRCRSEIDIDNLKVIEHHHAGFLADRIATSKIDGHLKDKIKSLLANLST